MKNEWTLNFEVYVNGLLRKAATKYKDPNLPYRIPKCSENEKIQSFFANIENINGFYANQYRGGFLLNNLLAVVAVSIALSVEEVTALG